MVKTMYKRRNFFDAWRKYTIVSKFSPAWGSQNVTTFFPLRGMKFTGILTIRTLQLITFDIFTKTHSFCVCILLLGPIIWQHFNWYIKSSVFGMTNALLICSTALRYFVQLLGTIFRKPLNWYARRCRHATQLSRILPYCVPKPIKRRRSFPRLSRHLWELFEGLEKIHTPWLYHDL